jgi:tRNA(adenine34) deaminase
MYAFDFTIMTDTDYMLLALEEARAAARSGEIPVGAVIVLDGKIIARSRNANRASQDSTRHAEIDAIRAASASLGNERLTGCALYVTKEPCSMCAGAIVHARIARVVIGAADIKYGACGTVFSVCGNPALNHVPEITFGVLEEEASSILSSFFAELRKKQQGESSQ